MKTLAQFGELASTGALRNWETQLCLRIYSESHCQSSQRDAKESVKSVKMSLLALPPSGTRVFERLTDDFLSLVFSAHALCTGPSRYTPPAFYCTMAYWRTRRHDTLHGLPASLGEQHTAWFQRGYWSGGLFKPSVEPKVSGFGTVSVLMQETHFFEWRWAEATGAAWSESRV